jgi:hypothetical protein
MANPSELHALAHQALHSTDPALIMQTADALIRVAEQRAPDEPPPTDDPALLAVTLVEHGLKQAGLSPTDRGYFRIAGANALRLARRFDEADTAYRAALQDAPDNGHWWFNYGLLFKAGRDFVRGLEANQKARELLGDRKEVLWNLCICATALGKGELAVECLRAMGLPATLSDSGMPFIDNLPPLQIRVATVGSGHAEGSVPDRSVGFEVLWVSPLSPCHGVVQSPTHRDASVDYGDVVLWDGTPVGVTEHNGKPVPRMPLLAILHKGQERRMRFVALSQQAGDMDAFGAQLPEGSRMFVHHERVEHICSQCAAGDSMRKHKHTAAESHRLSYGKIVLEANVDLKAFREQLDATLRKSPRVQLVMPALLEALGETAAAGKAHQMWRGLEKTAQKSAS